MNIKEEIIFPESLKEDFKQPNVNNFKNTIGIPVEKNNGLFTVSIDDFIKLSEENKYKHNYIVAFYIKKTLEIINKNLFLKIVWKLFLKNITKKYENYKKGDQMFCMVQDKKNKETFLDMQIKDVSDIENNYSILRIIGKMPIIEKNIKK
jgi:hypothetical protein